MRLRALPLILTALMSCAALVHTSRAAEPVPPVAASAPGTTVSTTASAPAAAAAPASAAASSPDTSTPAPATLDERIQGTKRDVIQLNRDLLVLEEELLFPASTQVAVFVSLDVGKLFTLDSVQIRLDDKLVANYLYTPRELAALQRGGVQRVFLGNLRVGEHELVATFTGVGPHERDYKRGATVKFEKGTEAKYIELRIEDATAKLQPEFNVKVWQ
ncbi:MAG TPA: AraC family transcriptional regulator [Aquabacterium sp.]|uniref:AraC family transcriptional regulator n=1 Tax=Aquabacterium sp. TaxID=1872578 RepID=UPI002E36FD30|nr:AraC family transcriptional regulator [Aquabacterium sp.]HEX5357924.1 AraC family transcriptional regulator [Aquabacterium sp.]